MTDFCLIFLIFSNDKCVCSSFRGGTLKDYDLRVRLTEDFSGLPKGTHWLQIKLKNNEKLKIKGYLISTEGKTDFTKYCIGTDWVRERVKNSPSIKRWLKDMTFNYNNINVNL